MPEVSVVIPTYNRASLLREAIHSVLQQSYQDIEVIVVDDGSTDNTREQVATLGSDNRIRYIYQENKGLSGARNTGIRASNGNYIALLDDDDLWLPEKLEKQMRIMKSQEQADIVYCNFRFCDADGNLLPMRYERPPSRGSLYEDLIYGNVIAGSGSAVLIRKKCIDEVGLFDENLLACEDQDLWRRMALTHHFVYIDEELLYIRWHNSNMQKDITRMGLAMLQYLQKLRLEIPRPFRHHIPEVSYLTYKRIVVLTLKRPKKFYKAIPIVCRISLLGPKYIFRFAVEATKELTRKLFSLYIKPS